jgi:chemotaxis protein methyltransferase CheR
MALERNDFEFIKDFLYRRSAISLEANKEYLVEARLTPLASAEGLRSLGALCQALRTAPSHSPLAQKVIEAMTTHETSFYRDPTCFFTIRDKILPDLLAKKAASRRLTIWSAACSTGQEPYSLLMMMRESFPQLAKEGKYNQLEINRGVPAPLLLKYFTQRGMDWQVDDSLRKQIDFCKMNLLDGPGSWGPFDLVLIRNVLIYFDMNAKRSVLTHIKNALNPEGYLIVGATEALTGMSESLRLVSLPYAGFYKKL